MSRIYHQLRPKKTCGPDVASSVSRLIFMRCHDNVQSVTPQSSPECRTDTTIRAGTVYTPNVTHKRVYNFLQLHNIFFASQYGFRQKHITVNAVCDFTAHIQLIPLMKINQRLGYFWTSPRLSTQLITIYCLRNYIIMEYVV